jgi:MerR family transcriptional regulator/heat shock protein HspR
MTRDDDAGLYVISVAAELAGLHPQTLRLYERKGLLEPARSDGGNRRYSERDLARLHRIGELTAAGVNLEGVRRILDLEAEAAGLRAELDRARADAAAAVEAIHRRYRRDLVPYRAALAPWRMWHGPPKAGSAGIDGDGDGSGRRRVSPRR